VRVKKKTHTHTHLGKSAPRLTSSVAICSNPPSHLPNRVGGARRGQAKTPACDCNRVQASAKHLHAHSHANYRARSLGHTLSQACTADVGEVSYSGEVRVHENVGAGLHLIVAVPVQPDVVV